MTQALDRLSRLIRDVPDFPQKGVVFKDICPLLQDPRAFRQVIDEFARRFQADGIEVVAAMESRGFIFGAPLAYKLGAAFVPLRKKGKLPWEVISSDYSLEYGSSTLEMHRDAIRPGQKCLVVDDLLATGGTVKAALDLVQKLGGNVVGVAFLIELEFLNGRKFLDGQSVHSLLKY